MQRQPSSQPASTMLNWKCELKSWFSAAFYFAYRMRGCLPLFFFLSLLISKRKTKNTRFKPCSWYLIAVAMCTPLSIVCRQCFVLFCCLALFIISLSLICLLVNNLYIYGWWSYLHTTNSSQSASDRLKLQPISCSKIELDLPFAFAFAFFALK